MPYEPFERVRIERTDLEVTRLGFGSASIAGLFRAVGDDRPADPSNGPGSWASAISTWRPCTDMGRASDGSAARSKSRPRDDFVLSTKVGRLVRPTIGSRPASTSTARNSRVAPMPSTRIRMAGG